MNNNKEMDMKRYTLDTKEGSIPDSVVMRPAKDGEYVLFEDASVKLYDAVEGCRKLNQEGNEMAKDAFIAKEDELRRSNTHIKSLETKLHEVQTNALVLYDKIQELESRCKYLDESRDEAIDGLCSAVAMIREISEV